jgi:hypothetical protein
MLPTTFAEHNKVYTKPESWTDEQCGDLPVWQGKAPIDDKGNMAHAIISCWKLSKEDLEEIQRTGVIWLQVTTEVMVPASLYTENPFIQNG